MSVISSPLILGADVAAAYSIPRSLRFNSSDSASCARTFTSTGNRRTWTWTAWIKRSAIAFSAEQHVWGVTGTSETTFGSFSFLTNDTLQFLVGYLSPYGITTTRVFRDPSAWFHVVLAFDATQSTATNKVKLYINGVEETTFSSDTRSSISNQDWGYNNSAAHYIGRLANSDIRQFNGYLADIHFIDGQALTPSSFGEFDANNIWQPKAFAGSYGTNGFHLPFSDNSNNTATTLGKDTSGNSNNWTPVNLQVTGKDYNSLVSGTATGGFNGSYPKSNAFDNDLSTFASSATAGSSEGAVSISLDFSSIPVTVVSTVRVYFNAGSGGAPNCRKARVNSGSYVQNGSNDYADISFSGTLTSLDSTLGSGTGGGFTATIAAIDVDGVRLVSASPSGIDSLVDSPSSQSGQTDSGAGGTVVGNYATLNPLAGGASLTNGNLDFSCSGSTTLNSRVSRASFALPQSGKWYWECTVSSVGEMAVGVIDNQTNAVSWYYRYDVGGFQNVKINDVLVAAVAGYINGDIVGVGYDADNSQIRFYKNGSQVGTNYSLTNTGRLIPYVEQASSAGSCSGSANFGQRPFAYTAPSGFKALTTANLPTPVIANGATAMDVKLYTGNGSTQTISGLGFSPDLVWIKDRTLLNSHMIFDAVRGVNKSISSDLTGAENTSRTDRLTAFNTDGFSLGADAQEGVNKLNSAQAAWCWDAGSSTVTNTQGSITSSVRANASAGFSVVGWNYPGGTPASTIGHGLGVKPGMIILKNRDAATNWIIYHSAIGATKCFRFTTAAASTESDPWNNTEPTSTVFSIGSASWHGSGNFVAYCFAPVSGYSAFGSYTGNGSADGPMVFCNFRPRFLMVKRSDAAGEPWVIHDTARDSYNGYSVELYPNNSNAEGGPYSPPIFDFLSNGFKLRSGTATAANASGGTFIYMALAESPFAYARAR